MPYLTPLLKAQTLSLLAWLGCVFSALASAILIVLFISHTPFPLDVAEGMRPLVLGSACVSAFFLAIFGMRMDDATVQEEIRNREYLVS